VRLGIALPIGSTEEPVGDVISRDAQAAEEHGFDSVWFFDSLGRGRMSLDPLIGVSVAAAATRGIEVGIGILQVPLRHPVELAHRVLTAQLICQGRLLLGVGAGSTRGDFEAVGQDYDDRMRTLRESLATMRRLWRGEEVNGTSLGPVSTVQGGPPVLIGSWGGERWIPWAAQEFDGWVASAAFTGFDALAQGIKRYRDAGGKRAIVTNISVDLEADEPLDDAARPFHLHASPGVAAERLQRLGELGFDDAVLVHRGQREADLSMIRGLLGREAR
jgi:alkanesulfonate monooxygenase SsuD/methylene tetrahydromethanopterin reductase-like flavin-dependent oxidoreductase (luciferase family)